jgi:hypothetical protein
LIREKEDDVPMLSSEERAHALELSAGGEHLDKTIHVVFP